MKWCYLFENEFVQFYFLQRSCQWQKPLNPNTTKNFPPIPKRPFLIHNNSIQTVQTFWWPTEESINTLHPCLHINGV